MTEKQKLHKELQKIKRCGHYYVGDILNFILADRKRIVEPLLRAQGGCYAKCNCPKCETLRLAGAG